MSSLGSSLSWLRFPLILYFSKPRNLYTRRLFKHCFPGHIPCYLCHFSCHSLINIPRGEDCQDGYLFFTLGDFPNDLSCHPCCPLKFTSFLLVKSLQQRHASPLHIGTVTRPLSVGTEASACLCPPVKISSLFGINLLWHFESTSLQ